MGESAAQPAIAVIGHPIGGSPAQFCITRALSDMHLDWQCLSFDVPPGSLPAALGGVDSLGFNGGLIAAPHERSAAAILGVGSPIDGWSRDRDGRIVPHNFRDAAVGLLIARHEAQIGRAIVGVERVGEPFPDSAGLGLIATARSRDDFLRSEAPREPVIAAPQAAAVGKIDAAAAPPDDKTNSGTAAGAGDTPDGPRLILRYANVATPNPKRATPSRRRGDRETAPTAASKKPPSWHPDSLIVDIATSPRDWSAPRAWPTRRPPVVHPIDLEVARIGLAMLRWTGKEPRPELLTEAIEEYLEL
jgi:hypothetical protein